jgi:magnesium chelatase subunit D
MDEKFTVSTDPDSKDGMPSRKFLREEVLACAKKLSALKDFDFVVVDTEDVFIKTGIAKELALSALGKYHHLDSSDAVAVASITRGQIER